MSITVQRGYWYDETYITDIYTPPSDLVISINAVDASKSFVILSAGVLKELTSDKIIISGAYTATALEDIKVGKTSWYSVIPISWQVISDGVVDSDNNSGDDSGGDSDSPTGTGAISGECGEIINTTQYSDYNLSSMIDREELNV